MRSSRSISLLTFVLAALCCVRAAFAQSDVGEIVITVVDTNNKPVANARTILIGPQTASSLTTLAGIIRYTDVPTGIYRVRVAKTGLTGASSREFDVLSGRSVNVRVALLPPRSAPGAAGTSSASGGASGLRTIATVTTRTQVTISTSDVGDGGPIRRLSNSLTDALDQIAGVSVTQDATDPTSAVTVSLSNHDESQTAITLDGIPLSAPGTSANLRAISTDLFSGSSASTSPSAGALGGGVNFRTLQPTQALQLHLNGTTGTYDRSNYQIAGTGSIGSLGLALQHTWRGSNSPLTFDDYKDESGLTYPHEGESTSLGDFAKFRYRLGDERTTVSGTALSNNLAATAVCARDVTLLPCGIGPGNGNDGRFGFAYANVASLVGDVTTSFTGYTSSSRQTTNDSNRYVLAAPCVTLGDIVPEPGCNPDAGGYDVTLSPSLSTNDTLTRGVAYSAAISPGRHTISLTGNTYASINTSTPIAGSRFEVPFTNAISSSTYTLSDAYKVDERLTVTPHASLANTTTLGTSALGGLGASWQATKSDVLGASVDFGSSQPSININRSYSDPIGARYDCGARTAIVSGPGDTNGGSQSAASLNISAVHTFGFGGTFTASVFNQVQSGQLITALIAEPASYFASQAGYLGDVTSVFQSPSVCGANAGTPNVFVQESVGGTRRVYRGVNLSGRVPFGRNLVAITNYSLNAAILEAASARLDDGPSTTLVGAQLPNRPLHRGNVTLDGFLPRANLELLANAQYTGTNNQQNLGPYVEFSAGISHGFGPGQVTLFENNIFNTYGGIFATDTGSTPLPLSNGAALFTAATPLLPRTINLSYAVNIGGPRAGPAIASFGGRGAGRAIAAAAPTASPAPGAGGGGGGAGGFGGGQFVPVAPPPGADPLSLASSRTSCDADARDAATPVFASLRAYVTAYEAKQPLPVVPSLTIVPHVATTDLTVPYYLEIHPKLPRRPGATGNGQGGGFARRGAGGGVGGGGGEPGGPGGGPSGGAPPGAAGDGPPPGGAPSGDNGGPTDAQRAAFRALPEVRAYRGFTGCSYITVLTATAGKAKGIVPPTTGRPGLYYVPKLGLAFVRPPELPQGGGSLKAGQ